MEKLIHSINMGVGLLGNVILLMSLFEYKYSLKKNVLILSLTWAAVTIACISVFYILGEQVMSKIVMLITAVPIFVVSFFITKQKALAFLFGVVSEVNYFFVIMGINYVISNWFFDGSRSSLIYFSPLFFGMSIFYFIKFLRLPYLMVINRIGNKILPLLLMAISIMALFLYIAPSFIVTRDSHYYEILYAIIATAAILVYTVVFTTLRYTLLAADIENRETRERLLIARLDAQKDLIETTKIHRHDLRHHDLIIFDYLEKNDITGAKQYLSQRAVLMRDKEVQTFCAHIMVNAVISLYATKAQNEGVEFYVLADVPANLNISTTEICSVFSNILENAMESCVKVRGRRQISLRCEVEEDMLKINLKNSVSQQPVFENGAFVSTKGDSGGIGLLSVEAVVKKHKGMLKCFANQGQFITQIIMSAGN